MPIRDKLHELNPWKNQPYTPYYRQFEDCFDKILAIPEIAEGMMMLEEKYTPPNTFDLATMPHQKRPDLIITEEP